MEEYSEKSFVLRGDTKPHKEQMKKMGGKWNTNLKGGPGWVFSKAKRYDEVKDWINTMLEATGQSQEYSRDYVLIEPDLASSESESESNSESDLEYSEDEKLLEEEQSVVNYLSDPDSEYESESESEYGETGINIFYFRIGLVLIQVAFIVFFFPKMV